MTHVSKNPIKRDVYDDITESFIWTLTDIKSPDLMKIFINDFFTKTEKLMLAKRLTIALLVFKGYETEIICQVLHVSTATVYRIKVMLENGGVGIKTALNKMVTHEKMQAFWEKIDRVIDEYLFSPYKLYRFPNKLD